MILHKQGNCLILSNTDDTTLSTTLEIVSEWLKVNKLSLNVNKKLIYDIPHQQKTGKSPAPINRQHHNRKSFTI